MRFALVFLLALPLLLPGPLSATELQDPADVTLTLPLEKRGPMRSTTPGVVFELREVERGKAFFGSMGATTVVYRLEAAGFPAGKTYSFFVWNWEKGEWRQLRTGFSADDQGHPVCLQGPPAEAEPATKASWCDPSKKEKLDGGRFSLTLFIPGQAFELALRSTDGEVNAFASAVLFPLEARDGSCHVWLQVLGPSLAAFRAEGEGFVPGETLAVTSRIGKAEHRFEIQITEEGTFDNQYLALDGPVRKNKKGGSASFRVVGQACTVTVNYDWGAKAFQTQ